MVGMGDTYDLEGRHGKLRDAFIFNKNMKPLNKI